MVLPSGEISKPSGKSSVLLLTREEVSHETLELVGESLSGRVTCTFDADGNQQIVEQPNGDRTTNVWDYENRLTATQKADGTNVTMTYTPDNRRVTREES